MIKRKVCIIDDSLPTSDYPEFIDETHLLGHSIMKYLCHNHENWPEEPLRELLLEVYKSHSNWTVSGFLNPDFYFNHVSEELYSPEVIIFDWDYGTTSEATEIHLLKILKSTYSVVGIYTGADKKAEIELNLAQPEFQPYMENRIRLVEKEEEDSIRKILSEVNSRFDSNFSFKLGQELKFNAVKALDSILVDIGEMSFDEFVWTFGHVTINNKRSITINEFIEILSEKFRNNLANADWSKTVFECTDEPANVSDELVRKLWSYRLYHFPTDDLVRVGDIISKNGGASEEKYLVISSDCHMNQLWKKNFGSLTLIPLYANSANSRTVKEKLITAKKSSSIRKAKASSITNLSEFDSLTLITSIPSKNDDGSVEFIDYVAFPRSIFSIDVPKPEMENHLVRVQALHYSHLKEFNGEERLCINEPFRSPLIQCCVNTVTGYGAPDYPSELQTSIRNRFNENFKP